MNLQNFIRLELDALITDSATSMTVQDPVAPFKEPFNPTSGVATIVLVDNEWNPTKFEVITYTGAADNGDGTWTLSGLSRGQESTTAQSWDAGTIVTQPLTAGAMSEFSVVSGNVGIGAANPIEKLTVVGQMAVRESDTSTGIWMAGNEIDKASIVGWNSAASSYNDIELRAKGMVGSGVYCKDDGNVGIGTASPSAKLDVDGGVWFRRGGQPDSGQMLKLLGDVGANWIIAQSANGNIKPFIFKIDRQGGTENSYFEWRTDNTSHMKLSTSNNQLDVFGDIYASGNITSASDIRFKENMNPIHDALEKINALSGFTYTMKGDDSGREYAGVSAQDVQKVLPQVVHEGDDGKLSVAYGNMVALLIEGMKEQQEAIERLEARITELATLAHTHAGMQS